MVNDCFVLHASSHLPTACYKIILLLGIFAAYHRITMKNLLCSFLAACSLTVLVGCACDNDRHTASTTSAYESTTVDSKDMHPVQQQGR